MAYEVKDLIELSELKIGNYLLYKGEIVHITSLSLDIDDEYEDTIGFCKLGETSNEVAAWNRALYNDLDRIPFTEDWLLKCGFINGGSHDGGDSSWRHPDFPFGLTNTNQAAGFSAYYFDDNNCVYPADADYVHQFQNLFSALTGKELKLKVQ